MSLFCVGFGVLFNFGLFLSIPHPLCVVEKVKNKQETHKKTTHGCKPLETSKCYVLTWKGLTLVLWPVPCQFWASSLILKMLLGFHVHGHFQPIRILEWERWVTTRQRDSCHFSLQNLDANLCWFGSENFGVLWLLIALAIKDKECW